MKFQVGDLVIGNDRNYYGITCTGRRGIVVDVDEETDAIELKAYPDDAYRNRGRWVQWVGTFWVNSYAFDLWEDSPTKVSVSLLEYLTV